MVVEQTQSAGLSVIAEGLTRQGRSLEDVLARLRAQRIEMPSWAFGNSGTRFKVFPQTGVPRTLFEKLDDAAQVQSLVGVAPSVALHIPWDRVEDWNAARQYAGERGLALGAINPNLFQDEDYKFGSLTHPNGAVRARAVAHVRECISIAQSTHSSLISLWLADGTNYPGQDDLRTRRQRLIASLREIYGDLPAGMRLLIEYKFFEPAFYATDIPDWGTSLLLCQKLGPQAQVLVDLGHHAAGANIEQIVATLVDEGRLGGFHFNARKYGDDDLIVGTTNPFELFLIYNELAAAEDDPVAGAATREVAYMIDQSHNVEAKIPAMIQSIVNCQIAYAKALLVDRGALNELQQSGDVVGALGAVMAAFESDVRPLLVQLRTELGLPADPLVAFRQSGYQERVAAERVGGTPMSW